jgi:adenylate kinase
MEPSPHAQRTPASTGVPTDEHAIPDHSALRAPGAGKGTQGKSSRQHSGFYHLSCGEVFRTLDMSSDLGRTFVKYSSTGRLVPDDVTIRMWHQNMHARTVLSGLAIRN